MEQVDPNKQLVDVNILKVPEEVWYGYVFPYLRHNDLLRLRRVCKSIKEFANGFIRNHFSKIGVEREINGTDATFGDFVRLNIPATTIYISNSGPEFFEDPNVTQFLKLYAHQITHLRVRHFSTCITDGELQFFTALVGLEYLELEFIDANKRECIYHSKTVNGITVPRSPSPFPKNFKNLKTLKLNEIKGSEPMDQGYAWDFIDFCTKLEYVKHPLYKNTIHGMSTHKHGPFGCVMDTIKMRHLLFPDQPNLKFYDLEHHNEPGYNSFKYCELVELCYVHDVRLLNVPADIHEIVFSLFRRSTEKFSTRLVSLRNVHGYVFLDELPNLQQVIINSTSACSYAEAWLEYDDREEPQWPKLKSLDIQIDSNMLIGSDVPKQATEDLLDFLFAGSQRNEMKQLSIGFDASRDRSDHLPVPKRQDITASCPNLTKLTLTNWLGTNKAVFKFWEGLPHLEDVTLEGCKLLGDVVFVGTDRENPSFLKLKKLKKLTLKGLDVMPKITDLIFNLVFRHLKIKQLYLYSGQPLKSITTAGIASLLTGDFKEYVEKFPFDGWSLEGVSTENFTQLKSQFRASQML